VITLALAILVVTIIHAGSEYRDSRLANWLADDIGFLPRAWLATPLYLLASVNILVPLTVAVATGGGAAWSVTAGALLADAFFTHILPTVNRAALGIPRWSTDPDDAVPGIATAPLQVAAFLAIVAMTPDLGGIWVLAGVSLFAPLRLLLLPLKWWDSRIVKG
jgi:hypothetical protein